MKTRQNQIFANAAPLGLFGFAMTTILLNIQNAGFFSLSVMIMSMGVFFGGVAQIIAGILEWRRANGFGALAFISYGSFWLTLIFIWVAPHTGLTSADSASMGWYLTMWGLFTTVLFLCTLKGNTIGKCIFGTLVVLFFLLAMANFMESHLLHTVAGYIGILCGGFAFYEASALILNERFERVVLPL